MAGDNIAAAGFLVEEDGDFTLLQQSEYLLGLLRQGDFFRAVVRSVAADEFFDQVVQGFRAELFVRDQHVGDW